MRQAKRISENDYSNTSSPLKIDESPILKRGDSNFIKDDFEFKRNPAEIAARNYFGSDAFIHKQSSENSPANSKGVPISSIGLLP